MKCFSPQNEVDFHNYAYTPFQNEALIYGLYNGSIKVFQEVLQTWDGYQHFVPKIETYMQQIGEIGRKENTPNKPNHGYNVLNHGDFHLRNSLIKLNSQKKLQQFCFVRTFFELFCITITNWFLNCRLITNCVSMVVLR